MLCQKAGILELGKPVRTKAGLELVLCEKHQKQVEEQLEKIKLESD